MHSQATVASNHTNLESSKLVQELNLPSRAPMQESVQERNLAHDSCGQHAALNDAVHAWSERHTEPNEGFAQSAPARNTSEYASTVLGNGGATHCGEGEAAAERRPREAPEIAADDAHSKPAVGTAVAPPTSNHDASLAIKPAPNCDGGSQQHHSFCLSAVYPLYLQVGDNVNPQADVENGHDLQPAMPMPGKLTKLRGHRKVAVNAAKPQKAAPADVSDARQGSSLGKEDRARRSVSGALDEAMQVLEKEIALATPSRRSRASNHMGDARDTGMPSSSRRAAEQLQRLAQMDY
jgi:hypothetical protein